MGKLIPMADYIEKSKPEMPSKCKNCQDKTEWESSTCYDCQGDGFSFFNPIENDKPIPPKKTVTIKKDLQNIDSKVADVFAVFIKSLNRDTHINPLVKRITYKDGKTRIGVIYEFVQLWNEFVPQYPILLEQLKEKN